MDNVFDNLLNLYSKHTDKTRTPLEDFTTEIFASILSKNKSLLDCFTNEVLLIAGEQFEIHTQRQYPLENDQDCIIDIVISNNNSICFLENKVNSPEGYRQLERYKEVLKSFEGQKNIYLRYCTKYYDLKMIEDINFHQIRWRDIYLFLLKYKDDSLIREFLNYMRRMGMSGAGDFNFNDMLVMNSFYETMLKMDECLDSVIPEFTKAFGAPYTFDKERLKQIPDFNRYSLWKEDVFVDGNRHQSKIVLGFEFTTEETRSYPILFLGVVCNSKHNNYNQIRDAIEKDDNFDYIDVGDSVWGWYERPLSDFLSMENQLLEIKKWFVKNINKLAEFKRRNPDLNWKV